MPGKKKARKKEVVGLLGVGLDQGDGHKRVTKCDDILLVGGSQETHNNLQEIAIRVTESLRERGKSLKETTVDEVIEMLHEATDD